MSAISIRPLSLQVFPGLLFLLGMSGCSDSQERSIAELRSVNDFTPGVPLDESDTETRISLTGSVCF